MPGFKSEIYLIIDMWLWAHTCITLCVCCKLRMKSSRQVIIRKLVIIWKYLTDKLLHGKHLKQSLPQIIALCKYLLLFILKEKKISIIRKMIIPLVVWELIMQLYVCLGVFLSTDYLNYCLNIVYFLTFAVPSTVLLTFTVPSIYIIIIHQVCVECIQIEVPRVTKRLYHRQAMCQSWKIAPVVP